MLARRPATPIFKASALTAEALEAAFRKGVSKVLYFVSVTATAFAALSLVNFADPERQVSVIFLLPIAASLAGWRGPRKQHLPQGIVAVPPKASARRSPTALVLESR